MDIPQTKIIDGLEYTYSSKLTNMAGETLLFYRHPVEHERLWVDKIEGDNIADFDLPGRLKAAFEAGQIQKK